MDARSGKERAKSSARAPHAHAPRDDRGGGRVTAGNLRNKSNKKHGAEQSLRTTEQPKAAEKSATQDQGKKKSGRMASLEVQRRSRLHGRRAQPRYRRQEGSFHATTQQRGASNFSYRRG
ncbi:hypothetical protein PI125_g21645 [Phytophthora idaei]|nr:hypothetical protein PI125_g21645 [Phytophthora idaei]KAG3131645.1 hypothetical protein PI126_g19967 [Phytophthora idaei]